jgi:hypothetical protein
VVQAAYGDCLIVEAQVGDRRAVILVDGGPTETYRSHLRPVLDIVAGDGRIDLAVLSHVDNDHVDGLLAFCNDLALAASTGDGPRWAIGGLWHNSFARSLGSAELAQRIRLAAGHVSELGVGLPRLSAVLRGYAEGDQLEDVARRSRIPLNDGFAEGLVAVDDCPPIHLAGSTIHIVGPTREILGDLREEWTEWLRRRTGPGVRDAAAAIDADRSVPNISSITMLVESGTRTILLTGDARADDVLAGLGAAGLLDGDGRRHVSILKLPHHGSARNIDEAFLRSLTADVYVISADGRYGNPDPETLTWIVETARADRRPVRIVATNETDALDQLRRSYPEGDDGYRLRVLRPGRHVVTVDAPARRRRRA